MCYNSVIQRHLTADERIRKMEIFLIILGIIVVSAICSYFSSRQNSVNVDVLKQVNFNLSDERNYHWFVCDFLVYARPFKNELLCKKLIAHIVNDDFKKMPRTLFSYYQLLILRLRFVCTILGAKGKSDEDLTRAMVNLVQNDLGGYNFDDNSLFVRSAKQIDLWRNLCIQGLYFAFYCERIKFMATGINSSIWNDNIVLSEIDDDKEREYTDAVQNNASEEELDEKLKNIFKR